MPRNLANFWGSRVMMPHHDPTPQSSLNKFKEIVFPNCLMAMITRSVNKKVIVFIRNEQGLGIIKCNKRQTISRFNHVWEIKRIHSSLFFFQNKHEIRNDFIKTKHQEEARNANKVVELTKKWHIETKS